MRCRIFGLPVVVILILAVLFSNVSVLRAEHPIEVERKYLKGDFIGAISTFKKVSRLKYTPELLVVVSMSSWALGLHRNAIEVLDTLEDKFPQHLRDEPKIILDKAILYFQIKKYDKALNQLELLIRIIPDDDFLFSEAQLLKSYIELRRSNVSTAKKIIDHILPKLSRASMVEACEELATHFSKEEEYENAYTYLMHAKRGDSSNININRKLSLVLLKLKKFEELKEVSDFLLKKDPHFKLNGMLNYNYGVAGINLGDKRVVKSVVKNFEKSFPISDPWRNLFESEIVAHRDYL